MHVCLWKCLLTSEVKMLGVSPSVNHLLSSNKLSLYIELFKRCNARRGLEE